MSTEIVICQNPNRAHSEQFYHEKLVNSTRFDEFHTYSDCQRFEIKINDKVILPLCGQGHAKFRKPINSNKPNHGFWCGYCIVPNDWYNIILIGSQYWNDSELSALYKKYPNLPEFTYTGENNLVGWNDSELSALYKKYPDLPEFTYTGENNLVGWDHARPKNQTDYTNLSGVVREIINVWNITQKPIRPQGD